MTSSGVVRTAAAEIYRDIPAEPVALTLAEPLPANRVEVRYCYPSSPAARKLRAPQGGFYLAIGTAAVSECYPTAARAVAYGESHGMTVEPVPADYGTAGEC